MDSHETSKSSNIVEIARALLVIIAITIFAIVACMLVVTWAVVKPHNSACNEITISEPHRSTPPAPPSPQPVRSEEEQPTPIESLDDKRLRLRRELLTVDEMEKNLDDSIIDKLEEYFSLFEETLPAMPTAALNQRFNLLAARDQVPWVNQSNNDLYFKLLLGENQFPLWTSVSEVFGSYLDLMLENLYHVHRHYKSQPLKRTENTLPIIEMFIQNYQNKLDKMAFKKNSYTITGIPWGKNWWQFTILSTELLAEYLLLPTFLCKPNIRNVAQNLILELITSPKVSLGYGRTTANTVGMAAPWILAHYFNESIDTAINHDDYKYVLNYIQLEFQKDFKSNGRHVDNSFVEHSGVHAFGYLMRISNSSTNYFYAFDTLAGRFTKTDHAYDVIRRLVLHKSIPYLGVMGLFSREEKLDARTYEKSLDGLRIMPLARIMRYYTDKAAFCIKGVIKGIGYYEIDQTHYMYGNYWVQYREPFLLDNLQNYTNLNSLKTGLILQKNTKRPKILKNKWITTTADFTPLAAESFVVASLGTDDTQKQQQKKVDVFYQNYLLREFGNYTVNEVVIIDEYEAEITIEVCVDNFDTESYVYFMPDGEEIEISQNKAQSIKYIYTIEDDGNIVYQRGSYFSVPGCTETFPRSISHDRFRVELLEKKNLHSSDDCADYAVLMDDVGTPIVACPLFGSTNELADVILSHPTSSQQTYKFSFNSEINQYKYQGTYME